jgi:hypothetical protein
MVNGIATVVFLALWAIAALLDLFVTAGATGETYKWIRAKRAQPLLAAAGAAAIALAVFLLLWPFVGMWWLYRGMRRRGNHRASV